VTTGIYQIRNKLNGKVYIGSAVNFTNRKSKHLRELRLGTHHNSKLNKAWVKYGDESFEIDFLWTCKRAYLLFFEQIFINGHDSVKSGYNVAPTAGGTYGYKHTQETKLRMSQLKRGKKPTHEALENLRIANKRAWTEERKKAYRERMTGQKRSEETKAKIGASKIGKPRSEEMKAKISAARKGVKLSEEHKKAISEGGKRRYEKEAA
jgi:group I intron endonuclease